MRFRGYVGIAAAREGLDGYLLSSGSPSTLWPAADSTPLHNYAGEHQRWAIRETELAAH